MSLAYNAQTTVQRAVIDIPEVMRRVYLWMTLGLLASAGTAVIVAQTRLAVFIANNFWVVIPLAIVEIGLVLYINARITRIQPATAQVLFLTYAVLNGITLSLIIFVYTGTSITYTALAASVMFGVTSVISYTTKLDLSKFGGILTAGVVGLFVAMLISVFVPASVNNALQPVINIAGVLIFVALTAYDTQRIKQLALSPAFNMDDPEGLATKRLAILGALRLYLDMINLFLFLIRLTGRRR